MEEEIKKLLNCGYYDECHNYIVELNEEKMKDFFHVFFKADKVIFSNEDMEKMKKENQNLKEELEKIKYDADKFTHKIMEEQTKRYCELKENGKAMIKAFAEYL